MISTGSTIPQSAAFTSFIQRKLTFSRILTAPVNVTFIRTYNIKRMCLGIFSRLARSLATIYIFARVRIIGTLVPFV